MPESDSPAEISQQVNVERVQATTPAGTVIECRTNLSGRDDDISAELSQGLNRDVVAAPSQWEFSGTNHEVTAVSVLDQIGLMISRDRDKFATYGVIPFDGEKSKNGGEVEPYTALAIFSTAKAEQLDVQNGAMELIKRTNTQLENLQSPIRMPLPEIY